jgi:L-ascorbate metabolism protein UlaG (beta-lactamase superfamily)
VKRLKIWQLIVLGFLFFATTLVALSWKSFGQRSSLEILQRSKLYRNGHFENPHALKNDAWGSLTGFLHRSEVATPMPGAVAGVLPNLEQLKTPPESGLRMTWLGHSTTLIEIEGTRILTDPVFSMRPSPLWFVGPLRWYEPLLKLTEVGTLDAVLISHDHYDHLDMDSIVALEGHTKKFIVPIGVGGHLRYWGIPAEKIVETDWYDETKVNEINIITTPARHASGRQIFDLDGTLWASYSLLAAQHRVFFSGDTGLFPEMKDIGEKFGPFDVTMIEVGQYNRAWPDWHIGPEQAVTAATWLKGKTFFPIHWGLLTLAYHGWTEPIERAKIEAEKQGVSAVFPRPGQAVELGMAAQEVWWPQLPFDSAQKHPIVSTW